jgi:hypothetical protein
LKEIGRAWNDIGFAPDTLVSMKIALFSGNASQKMIRTLHSLLLV